MPERMFVTNTDAPIAPNWGAIWAGMFTFVAIWAVFGLLGEAIFTTLRATGATAGGMGIGMAIWAVILTIIAFFVAGRTTGRLSYIYDYTDALVHGIAMFGLTLASLLVIAAFMEAAMGGMIRTATVTDALHLFAGLGWVGFVSLFLGWIAALGGACTTVHHRVAEAPADQVRRAAA